jgi:hypothetical protein
MAEASSVSAARSHEPNNKSRRSLFCEHLAERKEDS